MIIHVPYALFSTILVRRRRSARVIVNSILVLIVR